MEQFTNITEHAPPFRLQANPQRRPEARRAPLYASPWIALFILLRHACRQPSALKN
ncbi:MAG: hypothetical protein P8Y54_07270 [Xanthomonadales bacterium]